MQIDQAGIQIDRLKKKNLKKSIKRKIQRIFFKHRSIYIPKCEESNFKKLYKKIYNYVTFFRKVREANIHS